VLIIYSPLCQAEKRFGCSVYLRLQVKRGREKSLMLD